ncbi:MAG: TadE/TadG family type IV pilus assembly protein [Myxococcota bacterium]
MHKRSLLLKLKRRRVQRGAVAVEGVIVAMLLVGIMLGVWFLHQVFVAKWQTMQKSRATAWVTALQGCVDDSASRLYSPLHEKSRDPNAKICENPADCEGSSVEGLSNDGAGSAPDWFPQAEGKDASASKTVEVFSFAPRTLTTRHQFSCNEKPSGELQFGSSGALDGVADIARKIVDEEVQPDEAAKQCQRRYGIPLEWHNVSCDEGLYKFGADGADPLHWWTRKVDLELPRPPDDLTPPAAPNP